MIAEAFSKFGREKKELSKDELNDIYEKWLGDEAYSVDKEEFMQILMDIYEDDHYPIKDCPECEAKGKVCFENDDGHSHRISHGFASPDELRNSIGGPLRKSQTKFDKTIGGRAISSKESYFFEPQMFAHMQRSDSMRQSLPLRHTFTTVMKRTEATPFLEQSPLVKIEPQTP